MKNCFVYRKVCCWSSNYTQNACNDSKIKIGDCYLKYKLRPSYGPNLQQCIKGYKSIDNVSDIAYYMRDLLIHTQNNHKPEPSSFYIKSKQFNTFFGKVKGLVPITVTDLLANNTLKW